MPVVCDDCEKFLKEGKKKGKKHVEQKCKKCGYVRPFEVSVKIPKSFKQQLLLN